MAVSRSVMFRVWLRPRETDDWEVSACGEFSIASLALDAARDLIARPYLGGPAPYAANVRRITRVTEEVSLSLMFQAERQPPNPDRTAP